ncbi:hypothetical protein BJP40_20010 [Streptomyces sp. CC53]|uniref:hypothetical protein n=1 Tax=unclassified Streptomyces TaxID=2593676 RepID=UPI0008DC7E5F|nr:MULTISPECIES: hypothetical protein [unclassified Streptomyces]OII64625.1 hypothetical protein BJP40_20010 [Streptomyces sp. CC53]
MTITDPTNIPSGARRTVAVTGITPPEPVLADQAPVFEALTSLRQMFGHLPAAYLTVHTFHGSTLGIHLDSPAAFEAWRTALQVAAESVELLGASSNCWLSADAVFRGVSIRLTGHGVVAPEGELQTAVAE